MSKIKRNAPCPCGSGKKHKKCCLASEIYEEPLAAMADEVTETEADVCNDATVDSAPNGGAHSPDKAYAASAYEDDDDEDPDATQPETPAHDDYLSPDPCEDVPAPSAEQQALVDAWWNTYLALMYKQKDYDGVVTHITSFMDTHPAILIHLHFEEEVIYEFGAALARCNQHATFAALLTRIRNEHPEVYVRCFSYCDYTLLIEKIVLGDDDDLSHFFTYFHRYPDRRPDDALEVTELLAWTGRQDELFAFAESLAQPIWMSPKVLGGWFMLRWRYFQQYVPLLDAKAPADESARTVTDTMRRLDIPDADEQDVDFIRREFHSSRETPDLNAFAHCTTEDEQRRFFHDVRWNACVFFHDTLHVQWVVADFWAECLEDFWLNTPPRKKPRNPFFFSSERLERHLAQSCKRLFHINGMRAGATLEAVWHFAAYLTDRGWIPEAEAAVMRQTCQSLFSKCLGAVESTDPLLRLMPVFLEMPCRRNPATPLSGDQSRL